MCRILAFLFVACLVTGCARPGPGTLLVVAPAKGAKEITVLVATDRDPDPKGLGFSAGKSARLHYRLVTVSVPPTHKPTDIEWPTDKPDASKSFAVIRSRDLTSGEFVQLAQQIGPRSPVAPGVGMFIHGYNYTYQEALYRLVQMSVDAGQSQTSILFDWPSQGDLVGYVADRDAVAFARDDLASVLDALGRGGVKTTVLAHSMGGLLTLETLRQLKIAGRQRELDMIEQVVLAAPDIDIDLFQRDIRTIGRMKKPVVVLAAKDDKVLAFSQRLSGSTAAGALDVNDPRVQELAQSDNLQIIDISSLKSITGTNHDRFVSFAAAYPQLQRANKNQSGPVAGAGALVLNGVGDVISSPFRLTGAALTQ
ncbi:alpha/beta hydrolase [Neorhizobium alkalisoli]|nr:alpha/beta fold hydrolase [Neorhizobium alkalisoli]